MQKSKATAIIIVAMLHANIGFVAIDTILPVIPVGKVVVVVGLQSSGQFSGVSPFSQYPFPQTGVGKQIPSWH
jgi:hypothetical protein